MISVDNRIKQAISSSNKNYLVYATITLANSQGTLNLTNEDLWENGGFAKEEAVSEDNKFSALGATIIGSATLAIKNQEEAYSTYDFTNAKVAINLNIEGVEASSFRVGTYTVDEATYTEASINLSMLDNMEQFDRPYGTGSSTRGLSYPATLFQIVNAACLDCGVPLNGTSFPNHTFQIDEAFPTDGLTYREVVGMAAAIAGCYAKCNPMGYLTLAWFDRTNLDAWRTAYNNNRTPSTTVRNSMHYFTSLFSQEISVDPVIITGVSITYEKTDTDGKKQTYTTTPYGTTGYVIGIEKNELLNACTVAKIQTVCNRIGAQLVGLTFRKVSISHTSDPTIEAGDIAAVWDRRDRGYPMLVTRTNFTAYSQQKTISGAETPSRNNATRYSWTTKNYIESQKRLNEEKSLREIIEQQILDAIDGASGLYYHADNTQTPPIYYLHNFEDFDSSPVRIMFSSAGIMLTANGTDANPTWYGLTANGTMLVNLLRTTGFSFDWANGGTLSLGGQGNGDGVLEVHDASNTVIGKWDNTGINISSGTISGPNITVGGNNNVNGTITVKNASGTTIGTWNNNGINLSAGTIAGPNITVGGSNNANGTITVKNASGTTIGTWDNTGINLSAGTISGPNITVGGNNNANGVLTVKNASGTTIGTWNNAGINVTSGTISGTTISVGGANDKNGIINVYDSSNDLGLRVSNSGICLYHSSSSSAKTFINKGTVNGKYCCKINTQSQTTTYLYVTGTDAEVVVGGSTYSSCTRINNGTTRLNGNCLVTDCLRVYNTGGWSAGYIYTANLVASGSKSRQAKTENYGDRLLYCYETPTPMFGDLGTGTLDENGEAYISIDDIFSETIKSDIEYYVFLQKQSEDDIWVSEKDTGYFVVKGTPNAKFMWEIKAAQRGFSDRRLEMPEYGLEDTNIREAEQNFVGIYDYPEYFINKQEELLYETA